MDNLYRRNMNKKNVEPLAVDEWLKNEGYFRKAAPKDPGCLFRAVSEQIYMTQFYHTRVRKECVEFIRKHKHLFKHHKGIGKIDNYLEQMSSVSEWGGMTEIEAMSLLYKREFVVFYAGQSTALKKKEVTNNGFDKNIYLCFTPPRHYETVYKNHIIATAAFCQSIVYKILYKNVFKMPDVDATVEKMLHDDDNGHDNQQSSVALLNKTNNNLTTPPFPYRIAKALDPNIYRNTDFDIWWELKRQVRSAGLVRWNNYRLQVGGKCLVRVNDDLDIGHEYLNNIKYNNNGYVKKNLMLTGHIQEMAQNEGPVVVFIEELGEKKTVPFKALAPLHSRNNYLPASTMLSPVSPKNKSTDDSTNNKFKKQPFNGYRKAKDSRSPVTSPRFNSNDDENNNNRNPSYKTSPSKINYSNNFNNKVKNDSFAKNNSNTDYSYKKTFANSQSQSQSILLKSPSSESANPNSNLPPDVREFERRNSLIEDKYITTNKIQNNFQAHDDKDSSPPCNSVPETFPTPVSGEFHPYNEINEVNSICIPQSDEIYPNQNQIYCQDKNFSESQVTLPPAGFINYSHQINFRVSPSLDINGNDLPYSDITTLRYFFNLGLEYFHVNQMWWPQGEVPYPAAPPNTPLSPPPSPHAHNFTPDSPPGLVVEPVQVQSDNMIPQYDNAADAQINYSQPPNPQRRYINPVCPNDNQTNENNSSAFKNFRKKSPINSNNNNNNNKYLIKYKNEPTDAYNFGKPKYIQGYNENIKENGGSPPRKNQFGKFKKTNQGYQNRTCSKTSYQNDYQQKSYTGCSPDDKYKKKFEKKNPYDYQQQSAAQQQQQKTQLVPTDAPQNQSPQNNCTMSQQMTFANVPYYPNEQENNVYSPPHTNMYPIYGPHTSELPEPNNFSGAVMYASGNFPQQMPPIYSQVMYPPGPPLLPHLTPIFPGMPGQNSQPDWCIPGTPNCVPYPYPASQASESLPLTQSQVKK